MGFKATPFLFLTIILRPSNVKGFSPPSILRGPATRMAAFALQEYSRLVACASNGRASSLQLCSTGHASTHSSVCLNDENTSAVLPPQPWARYGPYVEVLSWEATDGDLSGDGDSRPSLAPNTPLEESYCVMEDVEDKQVAGDEDDERPPSRATKRALDKMQAQASRKVFKERARQHTAAPIMDLVGIAAPLVFIVGISLVDVLP